MTKTDLLERARKVGKVWVQGTTLRLATSLVKDGLGTYTPISFEPAGGYFEASA